MQITYDAQANALYIKLNSLPFHHIRVVNDTCLLNEAEDGTLIGIELLAASRSIDNLAGFMAQLGNQS